MVVPPLTVPPLLNSTGKLDTHEIRLMKSTVLNSTIISDKVATLTGGRLSGLSNPNSNQDAATKNYIDNLITDLEDSVQFNDNGSFNGSSNLLYDSNVKLLTVNGTITDGI